MSLFLNLLKTYDMCSSAVGINRATLEGDMDERKAFLPLLHTTQKSHILITLDEYGNFIEISRSKEPVTIIIPCTQESLSRTSGISPHPLFDQYGYLEKELDEAKYNAYMQLLASWMEENKKLKAVYKFLESNSIRDKLVEKNLLCENELSEGKGLKELNKEGVRFTVFISEDLQPNLWEDTEIRNLWIKKYFESELQVNQIDSFDYVSGNAINITATNHPKNINPSTANAKLISCNDNVDYTYRGRFLNQDEAIQIDLISSQKIHQALKWLFSNVGYKIGSQTTLIWSPENIENAVLSPFGDSYDIFENFRINKTDEDILEEAALAVDINYSKRMVLALKGLVDASKIKKHSKKIVIAIFDAATTGRMGLTFFQELPHDEYLQQIVDWHEDSAWVQLGYRQFNEKEGKKKHEYFSYIGCPSFLDIVKTVYGNKKSPSDNAYEVFRKRMQKQLLECMFGNYSFPQNIINMCVYRVSNPFSFTKKSGGMDLFEWNKSINVTCSLIKKYIKQTKKEEMSMQLEENRRDRDYLFGRLLSIANRIEQVACYKKGENKGEQERPTNAIRLMNIFSTKPYTTWGILRKQLSPYIEQLRGRDYYLQIIDLVMVQFEEGAYENNQPLSPLYLLGFSAQNRAFFKNNNLMEEKENDSIE